MKKVNRRYLVVYGKVPGSNFAGSAPDVPGCVSAGDTLEEMRSMMLEALTSHFEFMAEDGEAAPEPSATSVDFPPEYFEDVEYFVVETMNVPVPVEIDSNKRIERRQVQAA